MYLNQSTHSFYRQNFNNKIPRHGFSINNNHISSSSLSSSSASSSLHSQPRYGYKTIPIRDPSKRSDSLSSLSTTSFSSSITIILHALHTRTKPREKVYHRKKFFNKNHSQYENNYNINSSSSLISIPRLKNKNKSKQSRLDKPLCLPNKISKKQESILFKRTNRHSTSKRIHESCNNKDPNKLIIKQNQELLISSSPSQHDKQIYSESHFPDKIQSTKQNYSSKNSNRIINDDKTTSFSSKISSSNSITDLNNIILAETDDDENMKNFNNRQIRTLSIGIQTDNYEQLINNHSSIRQQYQYGNLRRVNSDLLDYIFIPNSLIIR